LVLFGSGLSDLVGGALGWGAIQIGLAGFLCWAMGQALIRRWHPAEPKRRDAIIAAAMFAFIGFLGLSAAFSGDTLDVILGGLGAATLLPAAAFIVIAVVKKDMTHHPR
jgi:predicted permease